MKNLLAVLFCLILFSGLASGASLDCGKDGQKACTVSKAAFVGQKPSGCPTGSFFDLIDGGTCWSCPEGLCAYSYACEKRQCMRTTTA